MIKSRKALFTQRHLYSIRKLKAGAASVMIGCILFGAQAVQASEGIENIADETEKIESVEGRDLFETSAIVDNSEAIEQRDEVSTLPKGVIEEQESGTSNQDVEVITESERGESNLESQTRAVESESLIIDENETLELEDVFESQKTSPIQEIKEASKEEAYLTKEYQIYPSPQQVQYKEGVLAIEGPVNLVLGQGLDIYTRNRVKETLQANHLSYLSSEKLQEEATNIFLGIAGQGSQAEAHQAGYEINPSLYEKIDAYSLVVGPDSISIVGKDSDSVFYGITTLKHLLQSMPLPILRQVVIEDYADIKNRGFIEGYYGNPWSNEDRKALMKYGGDLKLTQYFFAPKDDPYHNSRWRELYPEQELEEIRQLAQVGNESKTRYVWTVHPFMHNPIRFDQEEHYEEDLSIIKGKFTQLLQAGVREFGILADDAPNPVGGFDSYNRLMKDLTNWLESQQDHFQGLRKEMIFVPHEYWGKGSEEELQSLNANLPTSSVITLTGGRIWGQVSQNFLNGLKENLAQSGEGYRPVQLWINWPTSDGSKEHLILGGGEKFLHPNVDPTLIKGIMLNPMQQSEPSKIALFSVAEYTWKVWKSEEYAKKVNDMAFNFVETGRFVESDESKAFRELAKHMINQNMDHRVVKLEESIDLAPKIKVFLNKLINEQPLDAERDELREEFNKLKAAAILYKEQGNDEMVKQIHYWLNNTIDQMDALDALLTATEFIGKDKLDQLWTHYYQGISSYENSKKHIFWYVNHYEKAELGVQHIRPFILKLMEELSNHVDASLYPDKLQTRFITNREGGQGGYEEISDDNFSTHFILTNPSQIKIGDYVGLSFNKPILIEKLGFMMGSLNNPKDTFNTANIEYQTAEGEWKALTDHTYQGNEERIELSGLAIKAKGIRMIATSNRDNTWLAVREILVNKEIPVHKQSDIVVIHSESIVYKLQTNASQIRDDNNNTEAMFANANTQGEERDTVPVNAWVGLDLGEEKRVQAIKLVQGEWDKLEWGVLEYSIDGQVWETIGELVGQQSVEWTEPVNARYIRVRNYETLHRWWRIKSFDVLVEQASSDLTDTNQEDLSDLLVYKEEGTYRLEFDKQIELLPSHYIGIALDRLYLVDKIELENQDVNLMYSPNKVEWFDVKDLKSDSLVRYIRIMNTGDANILINSRNLVVKVKEIKSNQLHSTTMGINPYYGENDVRVINNLNQLFDGQYDNFVEFADSPQKGGHITLELGQERVIHTLRAYIQDGTYNYLRDGIIQVSHDGLEWHNMVEVGDGNPNDFRDDSLTDGWTHDSNLPGNRYIEGMLRQPQLAKYIRVLFTADYQYRFVGFSELVINQGEFVPSELNPTVEGNAKDDHDNIKGQLVDEKALVPYRALQDTGNLVYHLSDKTEVNHIRLISGMKSGTNVRLKARIVHQTQVENEGGLNPQSEWIDLGPVTRSLETFVLPKFVAHLLDIEIEWSNGQPTFYELSTFYAPVEDLPLPDNSLSEKLDQEDSLSSDSKQKPSQPEIEKPQIKSQQDEVVQVESQRPMKENKQASQPATSPVESKKENQSKEDHLIKLQKASKINQTNKASLKGNPLPETGEDMSGLSFSIMSLILGLLGSLLLQRKRRDKF